MSGKPIKAIAKGLGYSPEEFLQILQKEGFGTKNLDEQLSREELARLVKVITPRKKTGPSWVTRESKLNIAGGATANARTGTAGRRSVTVKVRKKSTKDVAGPDFLLREKSSKVRKTPDLAGSTATAKAPEKSSVQNKRVFSAETKKVIQDNRQPAPIKEEKPITQPPTPSVEETQISEDIKAEIKKSPAKEKDAAGRKAPDKSVAVKAKDVVEEVGEPKKHVSKGKGMPKDDGGRKRFIPRIEVEMLDEAAEDLQPVVAETTLATPDADNYLEIKKSFRKRRKVKTQTSTKAENKHGFKTPGKAKALSINLEPFISPQDLAHRLQIKRGELMAHIKRLQLEMDGEMIDQTSASLVVEHLGHTSVLLQGESPVEKAKAQLNPSGEKVTPVPVVTIMGHVDHGKTTLLDALRRVNTAGGEYGAITQHIGAYHIPVAKSFVSFLDTPGHAAFSKMRENGARITDVIVLVVAADDGVKPQTIESIEFAQSYDIPVVVAINKVDKDNINTERVRTALSEHNIISEEWGGHNQFVEISALKNKGLDKLLEAIQLQAEVLDKKVHSAGDGFGYVVESGQRKGMGIVATVLLKEGSLRKNDVVSAGQGWGRVRFLFDESNKPIKLLTPGLPATLVGLDQVVEAGSEIFTTTPQLAAEIEDYTRRQNLPEEPEATELDSEVLFANFEKQANTKVLNLYIKTDVQGSTDAIEKVLLDLSSDELKIDLVVCRQGGVYESDIKTASSSSAIVIGFNAGMDNVAKRCAENMKVEYHLFRSVYEVYDFVKSLVDKYVKPPIKYIETGEAEILQVFKSSAYGSAGGCIVKSGTLRKTDTIRIMRDGEQAFEGKLNSLRRFKDDVQAVNAGTECGIAVKKFDLAVGDTVLSLMIDEAEPA